MSIASQLDIKAFFIGILSRIYNAIPEPETQYIIEDKNIHFIWIGSEIPLKYINNILRCSEINKFYDIFIWSDYHFPTILMNMPNIICRNLNTIILKNKELRIIIFILIITELTITQKIIKTVCLGIDLIDKRMRIIDNG